MTGMGREEEQPNLLAPEIGFSERGGSGARMPARSLPDQRIADRGSFSAAVSSGEDSCGRRPRRDRDNER